MLTLLEYILFAFFSGIKTSEEWYGVQRQEIAAAGGKGLLSNRSSFTLSITSNFIIEYYNSGSLIEIHRYIFLVL